MAVHIGNKLLVHHQSIIVPSGEDARIEFSIGTWELKFTLTFTKDSNTDGAALSVEETNGKSYIKFINWESSIGTATRAPLVIGGTNLGQPLSILAAHWLVGDTNKLDVQFMLG